MNNNKAIYVYEADTAFSLHQNIKPATHTANNSTLKKRV